MILPGSIYLLGDAKKDFSSTIGASLVFVCGLFMLVGSTTTILSKV